MMTDLQTLLQQDIPEGRRSLLDSYTNLEKVAAYCEETYLQSDNKRAALTETKNFTIQSLASVAYQINALGYNFLQMLDIQNQQLAEMESQINHIAQTVMIHKEKVARREIGVLTTNKTSTRQYKIIAPANPERNIKYVRKPIDYSILDDLGHGVKQPGTAGNNRAKRGSSFGGNSTSSLVTAGPAPTTKPPTPPQVVRAGMGTLVKRGGEYRTPPAVAPPQVPSHYLPNYPMGHPKRNSERLGYSTLPTHGHAGGANQSSQHPVGMVHPIPHGNTHSVQLNHTLNHHHVSTYSEQAVPASHLSMPPPPSPLTTGPNHDFESHTGNSSPPLPPPPASEEDGVFNASSHYLRGSMGIFQRSSTRGEEKLPEWLPKDYLEKVVAIYDYVADKDDELTFQENCVIYVLKKNDDGWWEGMLEGVTGLFPGNYVEPCV